MTNEDIMRETSLKLRGCLDAVVQFVCNGCKHKDHPDVLKLCKRCPAYTYGKKVIEAFPDLKLKTNWIREIPEGARVENCKSCGRPIGYYI